MGQLAAKLPGARQNAPKWPLLNVPGGRVEGELPEISRSNLTASSLPLLMPTSPERPENAGQEPKRREEIGFSRQGEGVEARRVFCSYLAKRLLKQESEPTAH